MIRDVEPFVARSMIFSSSDAENSRVHPLLVALTLRHRRLELTPIPIHTYNERTTRYCPNILRSRTPDSAEVCKGRVEDVKNPADTTKDKSTVHRYLQLTPARECEVNASSWPSVSYRRRPYV